MNIRIQDDCKNVDWNRVPKILKEVCMTYYDADSHKKAFENSHTVVFAFEGDKLIGFARAISDGVFQSAVYDVAVQPEYQGKKVGAKIMNALLEKAPQCNFILYASPGKEGFYDKHNFKKMKTGMGLFVKEERMRSKGFIE